jgi:hypothetical protein
VGTEAAGGHVVEALGGFGVTWLVEVGVVAVGRQFRGVVAGVLEGSWLRCRLLQEASPNPTAPDAASASSVRLIG